MVTWSEVLAAPGGREAGTYDVIVVGAGHAGCEAAIAAARLGRRVLLLTTTLDAVAHLPCNPSVGGTGKGQLVREIDALGGVMGQLADQEAIQFRLLNRSRGPAVASPRVQVDREAYPRAMKALLAETPRLRLLQAEVSNIIVDTAERRVVGVTTVTGSGYRASAVVVATGTYLNSVVIVGASRYESGPDQLRSATALSASLRALGLPIRRFKTGTPVRVKRASVDFDALIEQASETPAQPFSFARETKPYTPKASRPCHLVWTNEATRRAIVDNLDRSPLYSGLIDGIGPRYCPSIEDKYVKFPTHDAHHVFVEPTALDGDELYLSGLSTSMPEDVQEAVVTSLKGFSKAEIVRYGYAIEYDNVDPTALRASLETRAWRGLYLAGQINGSSGYEEAAAQGLVAGINAARAVVGQAPLEVDRSQAYLFVLIDDLVHRGTREPYRMMTSRAEYRLLLRQDNADRRLTPIGRAIGLIDDTRWALFSAKMQALEAERQRLETTRIRPSDAVNEALTRCGSSPLKTGVSLMVLLKRSEVSYADLAAIDPHPERRLPDVWGLSLEYDVHYEGYVQLDEARRARFLALERTHLPDDLRYETITGLRLEARQVLAARRPDTLGQASRLPGVNPADVHVLGVVLAARRRAAGEKERA